MAGPDMPNGDGWFSAEEQAALDAFETGGISAAASELGEVEPEISAEELENFKSRSIDELAAEIEGKPEESVDEEGVAIDESNESESEDDAEVESDEDSSDGEEESEEEVSELFVDGPSGKKIKVDLKPTQDKLIKLHQAADRARLYQSQLDKMKHEASQNEAKMTELSETAELFDRLNEMSEDLDYDDPSSFNDLISVLSEGKITMDDLVEKAMSERDYVSELSEDALALYEMRKELKLEKRELEKAKQRQARDDSRAKQEHESRVKKEQETMVYNAFLKHDVRGKLGDQARENGIMERAWSQALMKLKDFETVTPEVAEEVFKAEIDFFRGPSEAEVNQKVDKVVRKKSATATKKAQKAAAPKSNATSREDIEKMSFEEALANLGNIRL